MNWVISKHWDKVLKKTGDIICNSKIRVSFLESLELTCQNGAWFLWEGRHVQGGLTISLSLSSMRIAGPEMLCLVPGYMYEARGTLEEDDSGKKGLIFFVYVLSLLWDVSPNVPFW